MVSTVKKVIDKQIERERKELSKKLNINKVAEKNDRLISNLDYIDFCLGFQKISSLFEGYVVMGKIKNEELQASFQSLANDVHGDKVVEPKFKKFKAWLNPTSATESLNKISKELEESTNRFCYNAFNLRIATSQEDVLGDNYLGFSEQEFRAIDGALLSTRSVFKELAGDSATSLLETAVDEKFGTEAAGEVEGLTDLEKYTEQDQWQLIEIPKDSDREFSAMSALGFAGQSATTLIKMKEQIVELSKINKEINEDDKDWKTVRKIIKYTVTIAEMIDNVSKSVFSAIETFTGGIKISFPFLSVVSALAKLIDSLIARIQFGREHDQETLPPKDEVEKSFLNWDILDAGMEFLNEGISLVLSLVGAASGGLSLAINAMVKFVVVSIQTFCSIMKLRKLKAMKKAMMDLLAQQLEDFTRASDTNKKLLIQQRCSYYSSIFKSLLDSELEELGQDVLGKQAFIDQFQTEMEGTEGKAIILQKNKRVIDIICNENPENCYDFLNELEIDVSFINTDSAFQTKLKQIGINRSVGSITSIFSVYKGWVGQDRNTQAEGAKEEIQYALKLSTKLLQNDYTPIFFSPRYDIYACRGCGNSNMELSRVEDFVRGNKLADLYNEVKTKSGRDIKFQDSFQFIDLNLEKPTDEISTYFVGIFNEADTTDTSILQELVVVSPLKIKRGIFSDSTILPANFQIPASINKRTNIYNTHAKLILFCLDQTIINQASEELVKPKYKNINILSTYVYKMKAKFDVPSQYFYLTLAENSFDADAFCDKLVVKKSEISRYCRHQVFTYSPEDKDRNVYKYTLFVEDYPDFNINYFNDAGWFDAAQKTFVFDEKNFFTANLYEDVTVHLLSKKVMRYNNFETKPTTIVNIVRSLESKKEEIFKKMVDHIKPITCSKDCINSAPIISRRSSKNPKIMRSLNVCLMDEHFWYFKIMDIMNHSYESIGCLSKHACTAADKFWAGEALAVTPEVEKMTYYQCPLKGKIDNLVICPEPSAMITKPVGLNLKKKNK